MFISNNPTHSFGGFAIDASKIKMRSTSERNIELSYIGKIPDALEAETATARIGVCIPITLTPRAVLILTDHSGNDHRYTLDATGAELEDVLQRFFSNANGGTRFDCGLSEYWTGFMQAQFITWQALQHRPQDIIQQIPRDERRSA